LGKKWGSSPLRLLSMPTNPSTLAGQQYRMLRYAAPRDHPQSHALVRRADLLLLSKCQFEKNFFHWCERPRNIMFLEPNINLLGDVFSLYVVMVSRPFREYDRWAVVSMLFTVQVPLLITAWPTACRTIFSMGDITKAPFDGAICKYCFYIFIIH
jgi:hypothetical protein